MNPDVKQKWVAALRSGEYKQAHFALHYKFEDTYCCLGVLCEIAADEGICKPESTIRGSVLYDGQETELPQSVVDWAELDSGNPRVKVYGDEQVTASLINLNDSTHYHFPKLADLIEQSL